MTKGAGDRVDVYGGECGCVWKERETGTNRF